MATKTKQHAFSSPHAAGIFADLSVDGPEIGTLVAVVDRAKNLPNRKTIGKQDPYCAARLGKEAKKTATDVRGGQTPKWDQELRFTVHDGPDYYQLKISVFTDDKRTDLVGESWIDLKSIIVPGGGQGDIWQTLSCRGKYAGEIRVEITYYDTRPKPEKPVAKPRPQAAATEQDNGSMKQRTPMKRRPLPSDPVTGEAPVTPPAPAPPPAALPRVSPAQDQHQTPPHAHAKHASHSGYISSYSPLQSVEYQTPPSAPRYQHQDHYSPSPRGQHQTPPRMDTSRQAPPQVDLYETPPRHYDDRQYNPRPSVPPYQHAEPSRGQPMPEHCDDREYNPRPSIPPYQNAEPSRGPPMPEHYDDREYSPRPSIPPYQNAEPSRGPPMPEHYDHMPTMDDRRQLPSVDDDQPPPPPAHRTAYGGGGQEVVHRRSFDMPPHKPTPPMSMRHDVLKNEAHRHSISAYPASRPAFRAYDSAPPAPNPVPPQGAPGYEPSPSRHHSYDPSYDSQYRSMQATVEDVPDSPTGPYSGGYCRGGSRGAHPSEMGYEYDHGSSPAPLNLSRSPGPSPRHYTPSPREPSVGYDDHGEHPRALSPGAGREFSTSPGQAHHGQPSSNRGQYSHYGQEYEARMRRASNQNLPELPSSLVPGADPYLTQEISDRIHDERRHERRYTTQNVDTQPRGRYASEPPPSYGSGEGGSAYGYAPQQSYERRSGSDATYFGGPEQHMTRPGNPSPNPPANAQHAIKRKSVSPAPPPAEDRRASDIPFGPDSFDAFNPNMASSRDEAGLVDPDAKIVTHDGREVDPSDHLPMESWAPEPEAKQQKQASPEPRGRPSPSGAQPMPPSGRRQLRVAARPSPAAAASHPSYGPQQQPQTPPTPSSAGRNRLHKKSRPSASTPAGGGSPLAPISPDNYQDRQSPYTPTRGGPREGPYDYPNENHAPHYGSAPPIPAKVPLAVMSGANVGPGEDALMQEMQRIDIGAGRSRRRGGY